MTRFILSFSFVVAAALTPVFAAAQKPNFIIVFCDDLGDVDHPGKGQRKAGWVDEASPRLLTK